MPLPATRTLHYLICVLAVAALLTAVWCGYSAIPTSPVASVQIVEGWPWFEDSYFNLRFQYPANWTVEKIETTNYSDDSQLDLMGEDAALAGPDQYQTWVIRVTPPRADIRHGGGNIANPAIIIEQPDRSHRNSHLHSNVIRPPDREFESVLDPYSETFVFDFTDHAVLSNGTATTSMSWGHSPAGTVAGVTALSSLPSGYQFQSHLVMAEEPERTGANLLVFTRIVGSMQLFYPGRPFEADDYRLPAGPAKYLVPPYGR